MVSEGTMEVGLKKFFFTLPFKICKEMVQVLSQSLNDYHKTDKGGPHPGQWVALLIMRLSYYHILIVKRHQ